MNVLSLANTSLKRACLCIASLFLFFFISCATADTSPTSSPAPNDQAQQFADLIRTSNPSAPFTVSLDRSTPTAPVIVLTATEANAVASPSSFTVAISQEAEVLTTSPTEFTVTAVAVISPHEETTTVMATFGSANPVELTVKVIIHAAPVNDWLTASTVSQYITAAFASQTATLLLDDTTKVLSVTGLTNAYNGADGSISFTLPTGFTATPSSIALPDPDGTATDAAAITPSETSFSISEDGQSTNSLAYTIEDPISLAGLSGFTPGIHINVADDATSMPVENLIISEAGGTITITGLVNTVDSTDKIYTLTISEVAGIFTTPGNTDITITITDPSGFSPGDGILSENTFTVTNQGESTGTPYTLQVPFRGAPIAQWLTTANIDTYITATFNSQPGTLLLDDATKTLSVTGLTNANNGADGSIAIANLPTGYIATPISIALPDPDGADTGDATIAPNPATFTISEIDRSDNSQSYTINAITLAAVPNDETQQLVDLIETSNPSRAFSVSIDRSTPTTPVIVLTATNTVDSPALSFTVALNQDAGVLTTTPDTFSVTADNPIVREEK